MTTRRIEEAFGLESPPSVVETSGHLIVTIVISVMKSVNGGVPKELWGLSRALDLLAPRGFVLSGDESYHIYRRRSAEAGRYPIVSLTTHHLFNKPIIIYEGIKNVVLGDSCNRPLNIPIGVERLKFGLAFNHPIIFPASLRELEFHRDSHFNHPLVLPANLENLTIGDSFNFPVSLPDKLEYVSFGACFEAPLDLPLSLKELDFHYATRFNRPLQLPQHLERLHLRRSFNHPITLPDTLHTVYFGSGFRSSVIFGKNLRILNWYCNHPIELLPNTIKILVLGMGFQHPLNLEDGIEVISFADKYSLTLVLPASLKRVMFGKSYDLPLALPAGCARYDPK